MLLASAQGLLLCPKGIICEGLRQNVINTNKIIQTTDFWVKKSCQVLQVFQQVLMCWGIM